MSLVTVSAAVCVEQFPPCMQVILGVFGNGLLMSDVIQEKSKPKIMLSMFLNVPVIWMIDLCSENLRMT